MKPHHITVVACSILFLVYGALTPSVPSGFADSDEIITAGYLLSPAHPPGYGLNIILVHLAQKLLFFTNPAHAANILSSLFHSLALALILQATIRFLENFLKRSLTARETLLAAITILFTGFSTLYWLYGTVIEVMSLGSLLTALTFYQLIHIITNKKSSLKQLLVFSITIGAGISHLQPLITLLPGYGLILLAHYAKYRQSQTAKHALISISTIIIAFFLFSASIIPLNARQQSYAWDFEQNLNGFLSMVFRQDYQGEFADKNSFVENPYISGLDSTFGQKIVTYLTHLWNAYAGPAILLSLLGLIMLIIAQASNVKRIGFLMLVVIPTILFGSYATIINYDPYFLQYSLFSGVAQRQYVFAFPLLAFLAAYGLLMLYHRLHTNQRIRQGILPTVSVLLIGQIIINYPFVVGPQNQFVYTYTNTLLNKAPENAVIICASDFSCFGLTYASLVEKRRPDVTILSRNPKGSNYFLQKNPDFIGYHYTQNPLYFAQLLTHNVAHRPTYLTSFDQYFVEYIGLDGNPFYLIPQGNLFKVEQEFPENIPPHQLPNITKQIAAYIPDARHHLLIGFRDYLASNYQLQSQLFTKYQQTAAAAITLDTAITLHPFDDRMIDWRLRLEELSALAAYTKPDTPITTQAYLKTANEASTAGDLDTAEKNYRKALYTKPNDPHILKQLILIYSRINDQRFLKPLQAHLQSIREQ